MVAVVQPNVSVTSATVIMISLAKHIHSLNHILLCIHVFNFPKTTTAFHHIGLHFPSKSLASPGGHGVGLVTPLTLSGEIHSFVLEFAEAVTMMQLFCTKFTVVHISVLVSIETPVLVTKLAIRFSVVALALPTAVSSETFAVTLFSLVGCARLVLIFGTGIPVKFTELML